MRGQETTDAKKIRLNSKNGVQVDPGGGQKLVESTERSICSMEKDRIEIKTSSESEGDGKSALAQGVLNRTVSSVNTLLAPIEFIYLFVTFSSKLQNDP